MSNPYAKKLKTVIFDIETMGLRSMHDMIISACFVEPESEDVVQLFAESPKAEELLIRKIYEKLSAYDVVISYNGNSFDIPFIETRAKKYGLQDLCPRYWSMDLYRYLRKYWPMAKVLPHLNQKSVEVALGLADARDDKIGGGECIPLYNDYLMNGNSQAKELILLHNADDVRQLKKIYLASIFLPYDQISFEQGFGIRKDSFILIESMRMDQRGIYIQASKEGGGIPSFIYDDAYKLEYDCFTGKIDIQVYTQTKDGLSFVDLEKLPIDDKSTLVDLQGYHSDYLILSMDNGKKVNYREINSLAEAILKTEGLF